MTKISFIIDSDRIRDPILTSIYIMDYIKLLCGSVEIDCPTEISKEIKKQITKGPEDTKWKPKLIWIELNKKKN